MTNLGAEMKPFFSVGSTAHSFLHGTPVVGILDDPYQQADLMGQNGPKWAKRDGESGGETWFLGQLIHLKHDM